MCVYMCVCVVCGTMTPCGVPHVMCGCMYIIIVVCAYGHAVCTCTFILMSLLCCQVVAVDPMGSILAEPEELNDTSVTSYQVPHST